MSITIKDFMECIDYRVSEGSDYGWNCFGPNSHQLDFWNGKHGGDGGASVSIVFDTKTQVVYQMEAWDNDADRAYRWINPLWVGAYTLETNTRGIPFDDAGDINFIDLEETQDMLKKARAIAKGEEYDTRVTISVELEDDVAYAIMKLAHEADLTFNLYVERLLRDYINAVKASESKGCKNCGDCSCGNK